MNTITTLQYLTKEIKTIFCHSTMVDRIANMLNYFLLHLVGPKNKDLKVGSEERVLTLCVSFLAHKLKRSVTLESNFFPGEFRLGC